MASGGYGITPAAPPPGDSSGPRFGSEEASGSLRMELQTPNCPQCPAWVVAWCRGRRPGAVLFTRSTGSGRSLRVVPLVIYGLKGVTAGDGCLRSHPSRCRVDSCNSRCGRSLLRAGHESYHSTRIAVPLSSDPGAAAKTQHPPPPGPGPAKEECQVFRSSLLKACSRRREEMDRC